MLAASKQSNAGLPKYLDSLDGLRGLAALCVVLFHWQNFFTWDGGCEVNRLPFYWILQTVYLEGTRAVDVFFSLSGFLFYWLYADKIRIGLTGVRSFTISRFSRLYPLHLVTLLLVAGLQYIALPLHGSFFVYQTNDSYNFILNLFLVSAWGFGQHFSFNGPAWSISIEALMYILFFITCRLKLTKWWCLAALVVIGMAFMGYKPTCEVGKGMTAFFAGGLTYYVFLSIRSARIPRNLFPVLGVVIALLWLAFPAHHLISDFYREKIWAPNLNVFGIDIIGIALRRVFPFILSTLFLCPLSIIYMVFLEIQHGVTNGFLKLLGRISYSSYMIHFPLQIILVFLMKKLGLSTDFFYSPLSIPAFYSILIPLSLATYYFLEKPCQRAIRSRFRMSPSTNPDCGFFER